MISPVKAATCLLAGLALAAVGCAGNGMRTWNPLARVAGHHYSDKTKINMARVQEQQGQLWKAREMYEELYQRHPKDPVVCHRLAVVTSQMPDPKQPGGSFQQARRYFQQALKLDPHNAQILTDYAYALFLQNDLSGAETLLRQALREQPGNRRATNNLAIVLGHQGKTEQSLAMFRRVVGEAEAQANLAYIHAQRGEGKQAVERYTKALAIDKNMKSASHALLQLAEIEQRYLKSERGQRFLTKRMAKNRQDGGAASGSGATAAPLQTTGSRTTIAQASTSSGQTIVRRTRQPAAEPRSKRRSETETGDSVKKFFVASAVQPKAARVPSSTDKAGQRWASGARSTGSTGSAAQAGPAPFPADTVAQKSPVVRRETAVPGVKQRLTRRIAPVSHTEQASPFPGSTPVRQSDFEGPRPSRSQAREVPHFAEDVAADTLDVSRGELMPTASSKESGWKPTSDAAPVSNRSHTAPAMPSHPLAETTGHPVPSGRVRLAPLADGE